MTAVKPTSSPPVINSRVVVAPASETNDSKVPGVINVVVSRDIIDRVVVAAADVVELMTSALVPEYGVIGGAVSVLPSILDVVATTGTSFCVDRRSSMLLNVVIV